ncbi:MAG: polysaccharide pyruvyl transferase family protein [Gallionellaceae bacterium]|nr:polysaccharide pyruvyl transferase family protein [Gallionellaceae bacterium]
MPITVYLTGQNNFGNRGCEALVRSTVTILREQMPDMRFLVPSSDIARDSAQWPEAAAWGVQFVPAPTVPASYMQWGRLCRFLPFMKSMTWPSLRDLPHLEKYLQQADAIISIGGDNYSLDYGLVSLFFFVGIAERALEIGKPVMLWAASIGPFTADPRVQAAMVAHLKKLHTISVRESHTLLYLHKLGVIDNVIAVVDPAFALNRQAVAHAAFWPGTPGQGVLGINVSPLIEQRHTCDSNPASTSDLMVAFIKWIMVETDLAVLLVPHVAPLDGSSCNNDATMLQHILHRVPGYAERLSMIPSGLNACELKHIIAQCKYFIGARTHATIAALSSGVPTLSIAYSIKARGINYDLFKHEYYVLPLAELNLATLKTNFLHLVNEGIFIRDTLRTRIPEWKTKATLSAKAFVELIKHHYSVKSNKL